MLERCAWRHARALCRFAHRDMLDAALFDDLDGYRNKRLDKIAMVIAFTARGFGFWHHFSLIPKSGMKQIISRPRELYNHCLHYCQANVSGDYNEVG